MNLRSGLVSLLLCGCFCAPQAAPAAGDDAGANQPKTWAILVGCEKYQRANPLRHTVNDVLQLSGTLKVRGGIDRAQVLEMTDKSSNPRLQPLKTNLLVELPEWLKKPGPDDSVIVYFSGHGFRDADGKMYLAPLDVDPDNPAPTGIAIEWLRTQIAACPAGFKLLVIDACHAGSEKGDDDRPSVAAKDLGLVFAELEKVVTLASSTADQKSQIWEEKEQSLFSYWLNQGLKGHADRDGDGSVDIDELYRFLSRNVTETARNHFPRPQSPIRIVRSGTLDVPVVVRLRPQRLKDLLAEAAQRLAFVMAERQLKRVGVLEFIGESRIQSVSTESLRADYGILGRYCAEALERQLLGLSTDKFSVVDHRRLSKALQATKFTLADLGSTTALKDLSKNADGMPVIVEGKLAGRAGQRMRVQFRLVQTEGDEAIDEFTSAVALTEAEWAMLGRSVAVSFDDRQPTSPAPGQPPQPVEATVIDRLDERASTSHPMLDPKFPFRVAVHIKTIKNGQEHWLERKAVFKGNEMLVPVRKEEVYAVHIENRSGNVALMRLLVDGLNTLPEKEATKGISTFLWGQRVSLETARAWELDPARSKVHAVRGFVTNADPQGALREFKVVDASQSLAAQQEFTDQIGIITVAFFAPKAGTRNVGTAAGDERKERIEKSKGLEPGNLLGIVHLRYVDADALNVGGSP